MALALTDDGLLKEAPEWFKVVLDALVADRFVDFLDSFCERECSKFLGDTSQGYSLEQTEVHTQYKRLYESRIESHLRKHGVSHDEFMQALLADEATVAAAAAADDEALAVARQEAAAAGIELRAAQSDAPPTLIASLLLVEDFEAFAKMMLQRALERE